MPHLPVLEIPCPHCTPDDVQKAMAAAYKSWADEEQAAYEAFCAGHDGFEQHEAWKRTTAYFELRDREPTPAGVGCVECDYTSVQVTQAGHQLLAFLNRHKAGIA